MKNILFPFALILFGLNVQAQSSLMDSVVSGWLVSPHYGYYFPFGNLKNRFGKNGMVGGEIAYKTKKNFYIGAEGSFLFGRRVKENSFLDSLYSDEQQLIGYTGTIGNVALFERGFSFEGKVGKLFPINSINPNSGILFTVGFGFLQHKIKITDLDGILYNLQGDYAKGYDRLSNGLMLSQSVMFLNLDTRHHLNFKLGLDIKEGFTKNRRSWNFDERKNDDSNRLDIMIGVKAAFILPFYSTKDERFYSY